MAKATKIYKGMVDRANKGDSKITYGLNGSAHSFYKKANNTIAGTDLKTNDISSNLINESLHNGVPSKEVASNLFTSFSKFGYLDPYNRMPNTKEVLFFTRPDLHIVDTVTGKLQPELEGVPFFMDAMEKNKDSIIDLQRSLTRHTNNNNFMISLHNRVKDTLELPDINSSDIDIPTNMHGNNYEYRGSSEASDDGHTFSLEFEDTKDLDIYMLFKIYDEYERLKRLGRVTPRIKYIFNKILHDQISIYKFVLLDDFKTISHYSKYIGCFPTSLPRSVFNSNDFSSSGLSLSINWKCAFIEDMNPLILSDFNLAMSNYKLADIINPNLMPAVSPDQAHINREWASGAYITEYTYDEGNGKTVYQLNWVE